MTSRIHDFADNWLIGDEKINQELNKIVEKHKKRGYDDESFEDDPFGLRKEQILEDFGIETWDELVEIVKSIKDYAFKSASFIKNSEWEIL